MTWFKKRGLQREGKRQDYKDKKGSLLEEKCLWHQGEGERGGRGKKRLAVARQRDRRIAGLRFSLFSLPLCPQRARRKLLLHTSSVLNNTRVRLTVHVGWVFLWLLLNRLLWCVCVFGWLHFHLYFSEWRFDSHLLVVQQSLKVRLFPVRACMHACVNVCSNTRVMCETT